MSIAANPLYAEYSLHAHIKNSTIGDRPLLYFRLESTKAFFILLRKCAPFSRLAPSGRILRTFRKKEDD